MSQRSSRSSCSVRNPPIRAVQWSCDSSGNNSPELFFVDILDCVKKLIHQRPDSAEPEPSCVSFKSDRSKDLGINFKGQQPSAEKRVDQESSKVPCGQSAQQHQTHLDSIFMLLEENIVTFVKNDLKKIQNLLSPDYPECSESQREDEDEEQRRSREAFLKITLHFLRRMKQDELADRLQRRSPAGVCKRKLKFHLNKKFHC
ncbi:uncharacterized protein LOC116057040 [Sander lucioperca]|uniref:uncharacterized protein LOC116057040 n=1 Tax=Sander lucioperca TaxID=283035 RepID=UPI001653E13E|nr:uncharacterized protein LOC116057040 [Sander lucioperca]